MPNQAIMPTHSAWATAGDNKLRILGRNFRLAGILTPHLNSMQAHRK